jgi:hypothetical protein
MLLKKVYNDGLIVYNEKKYKNDAKMHLKNAAEEKFPI